jgi:hypothetical protein
MTDSLRERTKELAKWLPSVVRKNGGEEMIYSALLSERDRALEEAAERIDEAAFTRETMVMADLVRALKSKQ